MIDYHASNVRKELIDALLWFGIHDDPDECELCENGSAWYGLTEILPAGYFDWEEVAREIDCSE